MAAHDWTPTEADAFDDLIERMERAAKSLRAMAESEDADHASRLHGKAEGVLLALSYVREVQR